MEKGDVFMKFWLKITAVFVIFSLLIPAAAVWFPMIFGALKNILK